MRKFVFVRSFLVGLICTLILSLSFFFVLSKNQDNGYHTTIESFLHTVKETYEFSTDYEKDAEYLEAISTDNYRVTIISPNGTVLADSTHKELTENHKNREEVKQALKEGEGYSIRSSSTLDKKVMYGAIVLKNGNILRVMVSMGTIYSNLATKIIIFILAIVISFIISWVAARKFANDSIKPFGSAVDIYKKEFFANASHELKTPITSIRGFAELISSGLINDKDKIIEYSTTIKREAIRMDTMVEEILKLSSLEDIDENEMPLEKLNVAEIIKEAVEVLDYKLYEKKIITNVDVHDVYIESVHEDILRVFTNLIENGIKYNKDNGKIYISLRKVKNKAVITIKDTGIGIKEEDLPHIFERFYRVDKSRNRKVEGTGLGLSIVKRIVMKYKGEISVKSTYNVGTEFIIKFDAVTK
ncbi:sensor histidine kinase [Anaerofustis stercorihominis]|uniref:sensor histidine kinase n=2 Tax=Anaerofustis TaxID=264995 RepID=UPI0011068C70|nr:ATP-binding protein [Anaerofustis stercorihominis]